MAKVSKAALKNVLETIAANQEVTGAKAVPFYVIAEVFNFKSSIWVMEVLNKLVATGAITQVKGGAVMQRTYKVLKQEVI